MLRPVTLALLAIFGISVAVLALLSDRNADLKLAPEIAKAILQLGVVSVVGAVVSLLIFEYQREKNQLDKQRENDRLAGEKERDLQAKRVEYRESLLLGVLSKALAAYSQAKKARRLLRARATESDGNSEVILAVGYDQYMDMINDAQLELENLARDVETSGVAFSSPKMVVDNLRQMEVHLSKLIGEYERKRPLFVDGRSPLPEHPLLVDFLRSARDSHFMPEVVRPYHRVQAALRKELLHPQIPVAAPDA